MSLEQKLTEELKKAMIAKDKLRLGAIRSIRAAILEFAKSGAKTEMDEAGEIKLLNNQAKRRRDAIEMFKQGGRDELAEKEAFELEVIMEFLPKQLSTAELQKIINEVIATTGASSPADMGKVMGLAMKKCSGQADGNAVRELVQKTLS